MNRRSTSMGRLAGAAGLTLAAGVLAACGGDTSSDPSSNASVEDFCNSVNPDKALEGFEIDPQASEDEQKENLEKAMKTWRDKLQDTGTPEDMPDDARQGYEELLEQFDAFDFDQSLEDIGKQMDELDADADGAKALGDYVKAECDVSF